jgi:ADP-dependent phosphofructokinase/glucokinase
MTTVNWHECYGDFLGKLPDFVGQARLTICGLATCVDGYVRLGEAEALITAENGTPAAALARELFRRAASGIGGEFRMNWPEGATWLENNVGFLRWGVGGTGAQAAQTLAILGAPALMSLEDRSARQLSVIHPDVYIATTVGKTRRGDLPVTEGQKPAHYIFEFTAGIKAGPVVPRRSSRTIVRFSNDSLDNDPEFARESIAAAATAGAAIVCGFNEVADQALEQAVAEGMNLVQAWRDRGLEIVHLELGDYPAAPARDLVLKRFGGAITSLGMNHSELNALCGGSRDVVREACELSERLDLSRLCIHADAWAICITKDDPERELEALKCGCLLAACRAEKGQPCRPSQTPAKAIFSNPPGEMFSKRGRYSVVCCASPHLERPTATIGLGDTFLAGTLLILGGRGPTGQTTLVTKASKQL